MTMRICLLLATLLIGCSSGGSTPVVSGDGGADATVDVADGGGDRPTVDKSKLSPDECSETIPCKTPDTFCAKYVEVSGGDPDLQRPRCGPGKPCDIVTCPQGTSCFVRDIVPHEVVC